MEPPTAIPEIPPVTVVLTEIPPVTIVLLEMLGQTFNPIASAGTVLNIHKTHT